MKKRLWSIALMMTVFLILAGCSLPFGIDMPKEIKQPAGSEETSVDSSISNNEKANGDRHINDKVADVFKTADLSMTWHGDVMLEVKISEALHDRMLETGQRYGLSSSNVAGADTGIADIELKTEDDYLGDLVDCFITYKGEDGDYKYNYSLRKDTEYIDGYYIHRFYEGLVKIPYRPDDIINELMPFSRTENARYYRDYTVGTQAQSVKEGTFSYADDIDITFIEPWRKDIEKIISLEDFQRLGDVPKNFAVVSYTIPEIAEFDHVKKDFINSFGNHVYYYYTLKELRGYVPVDVTVIYSLDKFGNVINTAEILKFPTAEDAVRFNQFFSATDEKSDEYYCLADIEQADTYDFRKKSVMEEWFKSYNLNGTIEGEKMYFPYDIDERGSSYGDVILQCNGVMDSEGDWISELYFKDHPELSGYNELSNCTVEYVRLSDWHMNGVLQVNTDVVKQPTPARVYVYKSE